MASRLFICAVSAVLSWSSAVAIAAPPGGPEADAVKVQAGPGQAPKPSASVKVDRIRARLNQLETRRSLLRTDKARLNQVYQRQLAEIDKLKRKRASWRRDRQIRSRMSDSHGIARKLADIDKRIRSLDRDIRLHKQALMKAIVHELKTAPAGSRRHLLLGWQRNVRRGLRKHARKIVLPEDTIDPLADPEELEYQASLLMQSEAQLARELERLDRQATHYNRMATLRKKYARADELSRFDDDSPRRTTGHSEQRSFGGDAEADADPNAPAPPPPPPADIDQTADPEAPGDNLNGGVNEDPMFDVVLADVVDASTIRALRAADMSSDPAVKAKATQKALEQVKQRIERLRKRRQMMQTRANKLRDRR